jgi:hypothetical protein
MEKYGVVQSGITPPLVDDTVAAQSKEKKAAAADLDNDVRKRAADAAQKTIQR